MSYKGKVMVGLSGGVDSAVAAKLLLDEGWTVEALFMKNWEEDDHDRYCAAAIDLKDAQSVADQLGIKLHSVNFASEYWDRVFAYFLEEYKANRTPNPDVLCNKEIKFKAFLDYALDLGADYIATGHYAQVIHRDHGIHLMQCADDNKDQTYFLYLLNQHQLKHTLFPLHELTKKQVRQIAQQENFINHAKKDSTGICFIGEKKFKDFLAQYLPANPGDMITPEGHIVGQHQGLMYYTIGQRKGLGIGGQAHASEAPWFVIDKQVDQNQLIVAQQHDHPQLLKSQLLAEDIHWIAGHPPALPFRCKARIRHRQALQDCHVFSDAPDFIRVDFDTPQRAITSGQSIVFYDQKECLGGAIIHHGITQGEQHE